MQAAGRGQSKPRHFADDCGKALLPQALFHGSQHLALAEGLGINHPIRVQARIHETGSKQITAAEAPEHGTFEPSGDASHEKSCGASELSGRPLLDHLMECSES